MIKVTIWNENVQEQWEEHTYLRASHPEGIHNTLKNYLCRCKDFIVRTATLDMPECGLPDEILDDTDVLIWWSHIAHEQVPDELARKIQKRVWEGMGFLPLHSSHFCKPLKFLLGTSCTLSWRENDFCRVWNINPSHPISRGIPAYVELPAEEMYGEPFDIPAPDEIVFLSWFRGGEVIRSGCTWHRGNGRIFYFQPGHETNQAYRNPYILKIIENAVYWAADTASRREIACTNVKTSPEETAFLKTFVSDKEKRNGKEL